MYKKEILFLFRYSLVELFTLEYEMLISRFLTFGLVAPLPQVQTAAALKTFFTTVEKAHEGGISYIQLWGPNQALYSSYPLILTLKELADRKNLPIMTSTIARTLPSRLA